jgi:glycosyltransferase involved in cell wall biosynthesis
VKILLIAQRYPPFVGGVEVHVMQISRAFLAEGHHVSVAAANFAPYTGSKRLAVLFDSLLTPPHDDFDDNGIPVSAICPRTVLDKFMLLPCAVRAAPILRKDYARMQSAAYLFFRALYWKRAVALVSECDVVHSLANGLLGWLFREAAEACGKPYINTPFVHPGQWGDAAADVRHYKKCDRVIGLVQTDSDYLISLGIEARRVATIGVSPDLPAATNPASFRERHGIGDAPLVVYVGRMMPQKGAAAVIDAVAAVTRALPIVQFVFIGPGSDEEVRIFDNTPVNVHYLGKVSAQEKADAVAACDVFCMPSMSEILPTVYLEAWSLGKPVVGGRAHGLPELIEGNEAGLAAEQNGDAVAAAIIRILTNAEIAERYGANGKTLVAAKYSVRAVTSQLLQLYETVRNERTHP